MFLVFGFSDSNYDRVGYMDYLVWVVNVDFFSFKGDYFFFSLFD